MGSKQPACVTGMLREHWSPVNQRGTPGLIQVTRGLEFLPLAHNPGEEAQTPGQTPAPTVHIYKAGMWGRAQPRPRGYLAGIPPPGPVADRTLNRLRPGARDPRVPTSGTPPLE